MRIMVKFMMVVVTAMLVAAIYFHFSTVNRPVIVYQPLDAIDALKKEIQGKTPEEVRAIIIGKFGKPTFESGSGITTEHWEVEGGVLSNEYGGTMPVFEKDGKIRRLYDYDNTLAANIFGDYEMSTLPLKEYNGTSFWLGNLLLSENGSYHYKGGGTNPDHIAADQVKNYFMLHPDGTYKIEYATGMTASTRLEDLPDGFVVATIMCNTSVTLGSECFDIVAKASLWRFRFATKSGLLFDLDRSWQG